MRKRGRRRWLSIVVWSLLMVMALPATSSPVWGQAEPPTLEDGRLLLQRGRNGEAATLLAELARLDPSDDSVFFALASAWLAQGKPDSAVAAAGRAVKLRPLEPAYHHCLARAWLAQAQAPDSLRSRAASQTAARAELEKTLDLDPKNLRARFDYLELLLSMPDSTPANLELAARQAEIIQDQDPFTGAVARARLNEGRGNQAAALASIREAAAMDASSSFQVRFNFGQMTAQRRHLELAEANFRHMLQENPKDMVALYQLGRTLLMARKNLGEAEDCFRRYLKRWPPRGGPTWAGAHWRLGMVYDAQGKRDAAIRELRKSLRVSPGDAAVKKTLEEVEGRKQP